MLDNPFHVAVYAEIAKNRIFERQSYVPRCHYPTVAYSRLMAAFVNSTLSLAPLHEGSFGPLHTQRGLLKPHFGNAKDGSNGILGYLTAPISGSAADGPSFSSSSHANHFSAAESYSPVRTISRAFSRISSHPARRPSTLACTGISIHTPGVRVCGSSG